MSTAQHFIADDDGISGLHRLLDKDFLPPMAEPALRPIATGFSHAELTCILSALLDQQKVAAHDAAYSRDNIGAINKTRELIHNYPHCKDCEGRSGRAPNGVRYCTCESAS